MARIIGRESGGRVLAVAEAKIIEADPALHEERVEAERRRRYVSSGRTDEFGLRTVIARVEAGDAVWVEATVARVAEIIAPLTPTRPRTRSGRSRSGGWPAPPSSSSCCWSTATPKKSSTWTRDEPSRATAFPADLLDALRDADLSPLAPKAILYVHLHEAAIHGAGGAVARVEGLGPVTLTGLQSLLARTALTVQAGARPVRPGPHHRLRAPRVAQGAGPPDHRRGLLALRHLHQPPSRLRPPDPLRRHRTTGSDRHPQLRPPGPATSPLQDPRRLPLPTMRRRADTSG